jgi:hypothetical protein
MGHRDGCPDENLTHMLFPDGPVLRPLPGVAAEKGHKVAEMAGLTGEGTGGFGALVGEIGVALRHRVHIGDGAVDLLKADRLLPGGADDPDGPVGNTTVRHVFSITGARR